jgi:ParB family transcriptional regulator, chromosome partitioning protein
MEQKAMKRTALGRGLGALIPGGSPAERRGVLNVGIEEVRPDASQPRRHFDDVHLGELAESIRAKGVIVPLLVRRETDAYVLVAGERRWRAAQRAGLRELPVIVRDVAEPEAFELALIENIQREDLTAMEEAEAFQRLIEQHGLTQEELARRVGKDRSTVANTLRLLRLPDSIKQAMTAGELSMGHARALLALTEDADLRRAAEKVIRERLSVRQVEQLVQRLKGKRVGNQARARDGGVQLRHVVESLQRKLATKVELRDRGGAGTVEIRYGSHGELDRILAAILG